MKYFKLIVFAICLTFMLPVFAQESNIRWESFWSINTHLHKDFFGSDYEKPDSTDWDYPHKYYYYTERQFHCDINYHVFFNLNERWSVGTGISAYNQFFKVKLDTEFVSTQTDFSFDLYPILSNGWETYVCLPILIRYKIKNIAFYWSVKNPLLSVGYSNDHYNNRSNEKYFGVLPGGTAHGIDFYPEYSLGVSFLEIIKTRHFSVGLNTAWNKSEIHKYRNYYSLGLILKL